MALFNFVICFYFIFSYAFEIVSVDDWFIPGDAVAVRTLAEHG